MGQSFSMMPHTVVTTTPPGELPCPTFPSPPRTSNACLSRDRMALPVLAPQPADPAIARDFLCQRCHGVGRVHDAAAEYLLARYASIEPPYSPQR